MVDHVGRVVEEFELNGHRGYRYWNATTETESILCKTCAYPNGANRSITSSRKRGHIPPDMRAWERHADRLNHPRAGEVYQLPGGTKYRVTRVSEAGRWADIRGVVDPAAVPAKRLPLPLPAGSKRVVTEGASSCPLSTRAS